METPISLSTVAPFEKRTFGEIEESRRHLDVGGRLIEPPLKHTMKRQTCRFAPFKTSACLMNACLFNERSGGVGISRDPNPEAVPLAEFETVAVVSCATAIPQETGGGMSERCFECERGRIAAGAIRWATSEVKVA